MLFLWHLYKKQYLKASLIHGITSILLVLLICNFQNYAVGLSYLSLIQTYVYFICDLFVSCDTSKFIHHLVSIVAFNIALLSAPSIAIFTAVVCGLMEFSNPFWIYLRVIVQKSNEIVIPKWYTQRIAGLFFMLSFYIVRAFLVPTYVYYNRPSELSSWIFYPIILTLYMLNVYWGCLLLRSGIKHFYRRTP